MKSPLRSLTIGLFCLGLAASTSLRAAGVVIEEIGSESALEAAGLRPGDLLLGWERERERGEIHTVFDWLWVKAEQGPRGSLRLHGERGGAAILFEIPRGPWDARVRPDMTADLLHLYLEGRRRIEAGEVEEGISRWDPLLQSTEPGLKHWLLLQAGDAWAKSGQEEKTRAALQAALAEAPDPRARVVLGRAKGESYLLANEMALAEASLRAALEADGATAEGLQRAGTMNRLGVVLRRRNRLDEAAQLLGRALEIQQRLAPDSLDVAGTLDQLGGVNWAQGDLGAASEKIRRALAIQERWAPGSLAMADTLSHLAIVASDHGFLEESIALYRRALSIQEKKAPDGLDMATSLSNLGTTMRLRGDLEPAAEALQRALKIRERLAPASLGTAAVLGGLSMIAEERGDLAAAEELTRRAMAIWEKAAPNGLGFAGGLEKLGDLAALRGDLEEAWNQHRRALEIFERLAPGGREVAMTLRLIGATAEARGDLDLALDSYQRSRSIFERTAPGTIEEALTLHQLGRLYRRTQRPAEASKLMAQAIDALESQVGRLGGSRDLQANYRARYKEIYRDAIEMALERGDDAGAFQLLERSRARSFLALLAERDLTFADEMPAALHPPRPFDLAAARKALDPGTLALSYSIGKDQATLFAVTRDEGLRVEVLKIGEEQLRQDVERLLERIRAQEAPVDLARSLYEKLIAPVAGLVEQSERVLILPDGPLYRLPFGALIRDRDGGHSLAEWKPLHSALSLTVYGTLRASGNRPASPARPVIAFGDPHSPRRAAWPALPSSRREVERVAGVYPGARLYLGEEATEERAKSTGRDVRVLHFATHGYLDDRTPLDSALVLAIPDEPLPDRDNGLLQVWEILEKIRLDADLVVLSACESALGRELSGEGLIGLTRAFQLAGARSVLASLWSVSDQATAELMARFHRHYASGLAKDEALRQAQIELMRQPLRITTAEGRTLEMDASNPFFWAAFQVFGDWR